MHAHAESGASTSQACFFLERARAHVASTRGNRRRARASAGHSISEWSNGAPCARGASPASRPRGDARSRGVVSREIHGFSRTRGERQRVFPSRARPETRRCERNDARGTSGLPGGGVLRPFFTTARFSSPSPRRTRPARPAGRAAHVDMLTHLAILFGYPRFVTRLVVFSCFSFFG